MVIGYLPLTETWPLFYVEEIMRALTNQMTGMYPTLIIVIVNFERTIWGDSPSTISNGTALNTLQFASTSGPTDTLGTHRGAEIHLVEITRQKSNVKPPAVEGI
jgi:hypothetical protein